MRWTVLIPVKSMPRAKSRLAAGLRTTGEGLTDSGPSETDRNRHRALVAAMRRDTIRAALDACAVCRVLLIHDRPGSDAPRLDSSAPELPGSTSRTASVPPRVVETVQVGGGLNEALDQGWRLARRLWPAESVAVLVGDLPTLRGDDLDRVLALAARWPRATVADRDGTGTTVLTATGSHPLRPRFGPDSAARHRTDHTALPAPATMRLDVDTVADLRAALADVGQHTALAANWLSTFASDTP